MKLLDYNRFINVFVNLLFIVLLMVVWDSLLDLMDCGLAPRAVALTALVSLGLWQAVLVLLIGICRMSGIMTASKRVTDFPGGVRHGGDAYWRLNRAHANLSENLGMFCAVIFAGVLLDCVNREFAQVCEFIY